MNYLNTLLKTSTIAIAFSLSTMNSLHAEMRYVDDEVKIPLRSGASTEHRIIRFLNSGTQVDMQYLNEEDEKWAFVTLSSEKEGWVQVRYLKNTPAAKQLLALSRQELSSLKKKNQDQQKNIKELKAEIKTLKSEQKKLSKHSTGADKELAHIKEISKNAIRLDHSNTELLEKNEILKAQNEEIDSQVNRLEASQKKEGMIYGVIVVVLGIFLGLILPRMKTGRSNDGWS